MSPEGSSRPPPHESAIFFLPRFVWTGSETTLECGFKRMQFRCAVWTKGRFVKTYINYGVSFFSKLSVFLLVCYTAVADYILVGVTNGLLVWPMIDHDRRQRERIKAISLGFLGYFGNRIFFYTTRPSPARLPSPYESGPLCCFNVRIVSCGCIWGCGLAKQQLFVHFFAVTTRLRRESA